MTGYFAHQFLECLSMAPVISQLISASIFSYDGASYQYQNSVYETGVRVSDQFHDFGWSIVALPCPQHSGFRFGDQLHDF